MAISQPPGINGEELSKFLAESGAGALMGFFDMFSGGALSRVAIFALGILPYISASIIFQLLTVVIPAMVSLQKEGEAGKKKITRYARYATVVIAAIQSLGISIGLESMAGGAFILESRPADQFATDVPNICAHHTKTGFWE